jgi:hypothetical protein
VTFKVSRGLKPVILDHFARNADIYVDQNFTRGVRMASMILPQDSICECSRYSYLEICDYLQHVDIRELQNLVVVDCGTMCR